MIILIIDHFLTSAKFHEIPRKKANSMARLKIQWPTENCGPYRSPQITSDQLLSMKDPRICLC